MLVHVKSRACSKHGGWLPTWMITISNECMQCMHECEHFSRILLRTWLRTRTWHVRMVVSGHAQAMHHICACVCGVFWYVAYIWSKSSKLSRICGQLLLMIIFNGSAACNGECSELEQHHGVPLAVSNTCLVRWHMHAPTDAMPRCFTTNLRLLMRFETSMTHTQSTQASRLGKRTAMLRPIASMRSLCLAQPSQSTVYAYRKKTGKLKTV